MRAYINHMLLNLGASVSCLFYAIIPPQLTGHSKEDLTNLSRSNPIKSLCEGLFGN